MEINTERIIRLDLEKSEDYNILENSLLVDKKNQIYAFKNNASEHCWKKFHSKIYIAGYYPEKTHQIHEEKILKIPKEGHYIIMQSPLERDSEIILINQKIKSFKIFER